MDAFVELSNQLSRVANDPALDPADRTAALSALRERVNDLLGMADRLLSDAHRAREAGASRQFRDRMVARGTADAREGLLAEGADPRSLSEGLVLSHDELDEFAEEGLLDEAASQVARASRPAAGPEAMR